LIGFGARDHKGMQAISAALHLTVGFMIIAISVSMLLP
jgi:type II secretory pathway component PulF